MEVKPNTSLTVSSILDQVLRKAEPNQVTIVLVSGETLSVFGEVTIGSQIIQFTESASHHPVIIPLDKILKIML